MQALIKYQFHIKTKSGITVNPILISAVNQLAAEKNLFQMYPKCQIIEVKSDSDGRKKQKNYQDILDMIIQE